MKPGAASDNEPWEHHSSENLKTDLSVCSLQLGCDVLPAESETTNLCVQYDHQLKVQVIFFILFFLQKLWAIPSTIIHWLVMSLCVCVCGTGSLMGHAASFLAISPSFIDWFVCKMEVMLWSVRTSRPRAWSPEQIPWSVLWQPQLFFWWVISCLPLIPWCVCACICASEISCYFPSQM